MKKIISLFFVFLPLLLLSESMANGSTTISQEKKLHQIDSLKQLINNENLTEKDLPIIVKIQRLYQRINEDSSLAYSDKEIELAKKIGDQNSLAKARLEKATLLWKLRELNAGKELLLKNIKDKEHTDESIIAKSFLILARIEVQNRKPTEAFQHTITATELYTKINDSTNLAICLGYMAGIQTFALNNPEQSIPYFEQALAYNNYKRKVDAIRLLINYSSALVRISKFDQALEKIKKAENLALQLNRTQLKASVFIQYASIYNSIENNKKSLEYALLADATIKNARTNSIAIKEKIYWYLALNYKALKNYKNALYYFKLIENTSSLDPWAIKLYLIEINEELGNYQQAYFLQKEVVRMKDSIRESQRSQKLMEVIEKYENDKKQQEINTLSIERKLQKNQIKQQQFVLFGTIGFFLLLIGLGYYWYKTKSRLKEATQNLEKALLQQQFLRTQLNPHFFFHALTSIEGYIYNNDKQEAAAFLQSFSKLMRNILEFSDVDFVPLGRDIEFIEKYLELQQLNHDNQFNYLVKVDKGLNLENLSVPPMLIQPFVENAILHGALSNKNGKVEVNYSIKGDSIEIKIKDNGEMTTHTPKSANKLHRSMSVGIIQDRIKNLKETQGIEILYETSSEDKSGTLVIFNIPIIQSL